MILVEGADGVGKTALCRRLVRELHLRNVPAVYRSLGLLPKGWDYYRDYLPHVARTAVMDRFHLSEIAYATAARSGVTGLDAERFRLVEAQLTLVGCLRVLITAEEKFLRGMAEQNFAREVFDADTIVRADLAFRAANRIRGESKEWADVTYEITMANKLMPSDSRLLVDQVLELWQRRQDVVTACTRPEGRVWT